MTPFVPTTISAAWMRVFQLLASSVVVAFARLLTTSNASSGVGVSSAITVAEAFVRITVSPLPGAAPPSQLEGSFQLPVFDELFHTHVAGSWTSLWKMATSAFGCVIVITALAAVLSLIAASPDQA